MSEKNSRCGFLMEKGFRAVVTRGMPFTPFFMQVTICYYEGV